MLPPIVGMTQTAVVDDMPHDRDGPRYSHIHIPIAPHPRISMHKHESAPYIPPQARYRSSSHRARPLILHKCEECVIARQKCTWSTEIGCDRCRRLEKHCHPRKSSSIIKEETSDTASQSEFFGVSDSAASAALALTELSAANNNDDKPSPSTPPAARVAPEPTPYKPSLPHVNPYQIPEAEVKRLSPLSSRLSPVSTRTTYFPEVRQDVPIIRAQARSPPQLQPPRQDSSHQQRLSSYQPHNQPHNQHPIPIPQSTSMTILNDQLKNTPNHKKKQARKGNNPHGNVGTYKCARCREFKAKCLFTQEDRPCKRCALANKTCGPKTLARENEHLHKKHYAGIAPSDPQPPHNPLKSNLKSPSSAVTSLWTLDQPLLPRILEMAGMEVAGEVARKLEMELQVLGSKVVEMAAVGIRGPRGLGGRGLGQGQGQVSQVNGHQQGKSGQEQQVTGQGVGLKTIRAVSLPPVLPDHNALEESQPVPEPMQIEKPKYIEENRRTERDLGSGLPQYQPYCPQCARDQGIPIQEASPASHTHFKQHPKGVCRMHHPESVKWKLGCSLHRGALDEEGKCAWCQREKLMGGPVWSRSLRQTMGYPGDDLL